MLINKLLHVIKEKRPVGIKTITIQQNNAKPHLIEFKVQCIPNERQKMVEILVFITNYLVAPISM